jgi:phage-related protein
MYSDRLKLLLNGDKFKICGLMINGTCEAEEYLKGLPDKEKQKLFPLLKYTADSGPVKNEQKFKSIGDGIFEFKGFQSRLFCFFDEGRIIILTHGCIKKRDRLDPADIKKARSRREDYFRKGSKK